jgi:effector-binding domain-containing protein
MLISEFARLGQVSVRMLRHYDAVGLLSTDVDVAELRGMLRLRRAELETQAQAVETRLAAVEVRLRMIEKEDTISPDYVVKTVEATRLVAQTATVDADQLGDRIEPMFDAVGLALREVGASLSTPIATYEETESGMDVAVGYVCDGPPPEGTEVIELPQATAVCGVHLGAMSGIQESWQVLHRWVINNGYAFAGPCREFYVRAESDDQADWVVELQQPVDR